MSEPKQDEGFKVIDRRLFDAEGQLRKEAADEERRHETPALKQEPAVPAKSAASPSPQAASPQQEAPDSEPKPSMAFRSLLAFLARNAELILGGFQDPRTGQVVVDIEGLRQLIEMLDTLREKTEGNLAGQDRQLLDDVLGDLKYSYVQLSQSAMAQAAPQNRKA